MGPPRPVDTTTPETVTTPEDKTTTPYKTPDTTTPEDKTTTPYKTPDTTTPEDKTTTPFETPASTTPSTKRCVYNNFQYTPGEEIGKVKFNGRCYLVYCDLDSRIAKKSVECQTTPPTEKTTTAQSDGPH